MKILLSLIFIFSFSSCEKEDSFVHYDNPPKQPYSERNYPIVTLAKDKQIDVLWIVDNSGSMNDIQRDIERNAGIFMRSFQNHKFLEWKMGLMSTDKSEDPYLGFTVPFNFKSPNPVITFESAVGRLGVNGDAYEYLFYNLLRAITHPTYKSFFRNNAHLAVIFVTDEKEQSEERFGSQYEALTFINTVKSYMNPDKVLRFYGAFQMKDLQDCPDGWGQPEYKGSPLETVIQETGGIVMSACIPDFGTKMAEIGNDIVSLLKTPSILLEEAPIVDTIEVSYKGKVLPGGSEDEGGIWYYDSYFNTINFYNLDFAPDFDEASIKIKFDIEDGIPRGNDDENL